MRGVEIDFKDYRWESPRMVFKRDEHLVAELKKWRGNATKYAKKYSIVFATSEFSPCPSI